MRVALHVGISILVVVLAWGRFAAAKALKADAFIIADGPVTEEEWYGHSATLLQDGKSILLVHDSGSEVWQYPGRWLAGGELREGRSMGEHRAIRLLDGRVLVAGGDGVSGCCGDKASRDAAVWDPKKRRWSRVARMLQPRYRHTIELLPDGRVIAIGGSRTVPDGIRETNTVEAWDPKTNQWSYLEPLHAARYHHCSVVLNDGRIMVMGGWGDATVEIYDPKTGKWEMGTPMTYARAQFNAVALPDGRVLVAGGSKSEQCTGKECETEVAEIWDPESKKWLEAGRQKLRFDAAATLLKNGDVLVTGGRNHNAKDDRFVKEIELWDHETMRWRVVGRFGLYRVGHTATLLPDGSVWVVGGSSNNLTEFIRPPRRTEEKPKQ